MKSKGILNASLAELVAKTGHGDMIAIVDRGFPFPDSCEVVCIDLAISKNLPRVAQVLDAILEELVVEKKIYAKETLEKSKDFYDGVNEIFKKQVSDLSIEEEIIPHKDFKKAVLNGRLEETKIRGYIRTGEFTFFGNVIIVAGVDFR